MNSSIPSTNSITPSTRTTIWSSTKASLNSTLRAMTITITPSKAMSNPMRYGTNQLPSFFNLPASGQYSAGPDIMIVMKDHFENLVRRYPKTPRPRSTTNME